MNEGHGSGLLGLAGQEDVQVLPVRDDEKGEVAGDLLLHLPGEEHHGEGFAGALGVPEHAQLALKLPAVLHGRHQVVDAEELVVLGDDLVPLVAEHDEILDIVDEVRLVQKAVHKVAHRAFAHGVRRADGLAVGPLLFGIHLQPFKEMVVSGVECPQPGLEAVTQHAHLVEGEQVGDVLLILGQVLPVGFLHLDDAVFQLHKDHGQAVDEDEHVRPVPVIPALDPHLGHRREGVVFGALEIHQLHEIEVRLPVPPEFHANAVADLLIVGVVDRDQVRAGEVPKKILFDLRQLLPRYARVQPEQRLVQHARQHALLLIPAPGTVRQHFHLFQRRIASHHVIPKGLPFQLLQDRLFYIVFGNKVWHTECTSVHALLNITASNSE